MRVLYCPSRRASVRLIDNVFVTVP